MTASSSFDQFADAYDATVQAAIGASGESVAYFAALKAGLAAALAPAPCRTVLDFGCGTGNMARALAAALPSARVTGCDASAASIEVARARSGASADFVANGAGRLPFADASVDLVTAACVFHHIERSERQKWAAEIRRVLRPGGRAIVFEHNPLNPLTQRVVRNIPFDRGVSLLPRSEALRLLTGAGLRAMSSRYYFFFPRWLAALRPIEPALGWLPFGGQYLVAGER